MKYFSSILLFAAVIYGFWCYSFVSSGLNEVICSSENEAYKKASLTISERLKDNTQATIIKTSGFSNSFLGYFKKGFIVVVKPDYNTLEKNMFCAFSTRKKNILHRLRIKTNEGWIAEGDGNKGPDAVLVTPSNYIGVVLDNVIYRY